jgi:hypothetical protein
MSADRLGDKLLDSVRCASYIITTKNCRVMPVLSLSAARDALTALEKTGIEVVNPAQRP